MRQDEAIAEARRRWGPQGRAIVHGYPYPGRVFEVWALPYERGIYGVGDSFEAAFADAEDRLAQRAV